MKIQTKRPIRKEVASGTILLILACAPTSGHAADRTWDGTSGNWDTPTNWSNDTIPTSSDFAIINNGGTALLPAGVSSVGGAFAIGSVAGGTGVINVSGGYFERGGTLGSAAGSSGSGIITSGTWNGGIGVGGSGTGSLVVNGGFFTSNSFTVGNNTSGHGTVTVTSGSLSASTFFIVGNSGTGTLLVNGGLATSNNGGSIGSNATGSGAVTVTSGTLAIASPTLAFNVGRLGSGSLAIHGGLVSHTGYSGVSIGSFSTANGSVSVHGGTWATDGELIVGNTGTGTLHVNGGLVTSNSAQIGSNGLLISGSGGNGSVTVSSGTWNSGNGLSVGGSGTGSLLVEGGQVSSGVLGVGENGSMTIAGGMVTVSDSLSVGGTESASATFLISAGSLSSGVGSIGTQYNYSGNSVTVTGGGSVWTNSGTLRVGSNHVQSVDNTLTISDGALVKIGDTLGETITFDGPADDFLRLDGGYIALFGNQVAYVGDLISDGNIQLWDGEEWIAATAADVEITYYTNDAEGETAAEEDTSYSGLGGYTVATVQSVPEPATALLAALGAGALLLRRRRAG